MLDFIRIACAVPAVRVADVKKNVEEICGCIAEADAHKCDLVLFPELAVTGYTCGDLFFQKTLQQAVKVGLKKILDTSFAHPEITAAVGLPALLDGQLYNCAAVIRGGELKGLVPKTFLPNHREFGEKRWFASAADLSREYVQIRELADVDAWYSVPVGGGQLFCIGEGAMVGVEICEDLWVPVAPSAMLALGGAEVIVNLAAANEAAGKRAQRRELVKGQSASCRCVYAFCSAGAGESTQDLVFSGHSLIAQNGRILGENQEPAASGYMLIRDADLGEIRAERQSTTSFRDAATFYGARSGLRPSECFDKPLRGDGSLYTVAKLPFVPESRQERLELCREVFRVQAAGLAKRLSTIRANAVIGISGGLDSTLALLVAVEAMRLLDRPASHIFGVTMPCFGTSDRTYRNSLALMKALGTGSREINIRNAVNVHFSDIGHDPGVRDTTYENSQARERTQILMDYAGEVGGIVVGTGDLSELALGWCTYNGDHMSMYGVNGSIPKTLIRWIIEAVAEEPAFAAAKEVLTDVLDTPISPELLPPDTQGKISQQTEDIVGPYALHDFYLYYMVRYGFSPRKIYALACKAFEQDFDCGTVKKWLVTFCRRFFTQQFKRNCQPDGVKAGILSFSPRGEWQMPSDAVSRLWIEDAESL